MKTYFLINNFCILKIIIFADFFYLQLSILLDKSLSKRLAVNEKFTIFYHISEIIVRTMVKYII